MEVLLLVLVLLLLLLLLLLVVVVLAVVLVLVVVLLLVHSAPRSTLDTTNVQSSPAGDCTLPTDVSAMHAVASTAWSTFMLTRWVVVGE